MTPWDTGAQSSSNVSSVRSPQETEGLEIQPVTHGNLEMANAASQVTGQRM